MELLGQWKEPGMGEGINVWHVAKHQRVVSQGQCRFCSNTGVFFQWETFLSTPTAQCLLFFLPKLATTLGQYQPPRRKLRSPTADFLVCMKHIPRHQTCLFRIKRHEEISLQRRVSTTLPIYPRPSRRFTVRMPCSCAMSLCHGSCMALHQRRKKASLSHPVLRATSLR
ncbi:hypothetical protein BDU57DRAFT_68878 [Ampelomyces quisqualis]|uniref:Uncharacterized protein n=1 Tax=Ampelomyces quisqualis TaxID=50730 RepID=A0A6A5R3L7_AMPQU|nr:hypothetical protein BDU57DRAFT_68878 [Ampelomyces quisqualis]